MACGRTRARATGIFAQVVAQPMLQPHSCATVAVMDDLPAHAQARDPVPPDRRAGARPLGAMQARAQRLKWRIVPRTDPPAQRPTIRLWLPVTPLLLVVAPLVILAMALAIFLPRPFGVNPATIVLSLGRFLSLVNGTRIEVATQANKVDMKLI